MVLILLMLTGVRLFGSAGWMVRARWLDIGGYPFSAYRAFQRSSLFCFLPSFLWIMRNDLNTFRALAESVLLLAVPLALIYAQPDMKNTITVTIHFLYSAVYSRTELQDHRRCDPDRGSPSDHIFVYCCAAGSDFDQGLSENTYYVFPLPGKRGIPGGY